jgi:hypothetical protein
MDKFDRSRLEDIHRVAPFSVSTLLEQFRETEVIGPRRRFALALLDLVARIRGPEAAAEHQGILEGLTW